MAFQILLNIGLAIIWMLLSQNYSPLSFGIGYVVGLALLYVLRRLLQFDFLFPPCHRNCKVNFAVLLGTNFSKH